MTNRQKQIQYKYGYIPLIPPSFSSFFSSILSYHVSHVLPHVHNIFSLFLASGLTSNFELDKYEKYNIFESMILEKHENNFSNIAKSLEKEYSIKNTINTIYIKGYYTLECEYESEFTISSIKNVGLTLRIRLPMILDFMDPDTILEELSGFEDLSENPIHIDASFFLNKAIVEFALNLEKKYSLISKIINTINKLDYTKMRKQQKIELNEKVIEQYPELKEILSHRVYETEDFNFFLKQIEPLNFDYQRLVNDVRNYFRKVYEFNDSQVEKIIRDFINPQLQEVFVSASETLNEPVIHVHMSVLVPATPETFANYLWIDITTEIRIEIVIFYSNMFYYKYVGR